MITGKRILITGFAGSIGSELTRQLAPNNKVFGLDISEKGYTLREELRQKGYWVHSRTGDVRDKETIWDVFSDFKPELVFHAAALKNVSPCEEYPEEAFATNLNGTLNIVKEAKNWECLEKFVLISTDKVVNANCIMGISKLAAESFVRLQGDKFVAVRFGNVMGSSGSLLEIWDRQVRNGEPITITDERMERYFMSIPQACELVVKAAESRGEGLMIMNMGELRKITDMASLFLAERNIPNWPRKIIGIRPGETLSERLMSEEEKKVAILQDKFYMI